MDYDAATAAAVEERANSRTRMTTMHFNSMYFALIREGGGSNDNLHAGTYTGPSYSGEAHCVPMLSCEIKWLKLN